LLYQLSYTHHKFVSGEKMFKELRPLWSKKITLQKAAKCKEIYVKKSIKMFRML